MSVYKFTREWAKGIESGDGPLDRDGNARHHRTKSCNVYYNGRTIYSYGSHFPMGYIVAPNVVWLNGDRFSNTTNRHQSELRSAVASEAPNAKVVIVPESALTAAGVSYQTIEPVDVHGERWEYTLQTSDTAPADMSTELEELRPDYSQPYDTEAGRYPKAMLPVEAAYGAYDYSGRTDTSTYADTVGTVSRDGSKQLVRYSGGLYRWHTARHWLGDAVFTGIKDRTFNGTVGERAYFISSFDQQERRPLYFLSQLPGPVSSVDEAIESLAPDSVKTARELGRNVVRQGDMFAIAMDASTRQLKAMGATVEKRSVTVELRRYARDQVAMRDALLVVKETMPAYPSRVYYQHDKHTREEFDVLHKAWEKATDEWADELVSRCAAQFPDAPEVPRYGWSSALRYKPGAHDYTRDVTGSALYGTAHTATEVATLPDGRQFARGVLYHEPAVIGQTRARDHARRPLGRQWHLVARNTVPVSGTGRGRRAA